MRHQKKFLLPVFFTIILVAMQQQNAMAQTNPENTKAMEIKPSATSSQNDFDFLVGKWKVHNRRLPKVLSNSNQWIEFESELHMRKTINGFGNVENYYATFGGKPFEGQAVRLFNPQTKLWTVYWMDSSNPTMDQHPVTGSFENGVGKLYAPDTFDGKPVLSLYQWDARDPKHPKWSQALSTDDGKTWEFNWEMTLTRIE
jgi:hypothetical protein